MAAEGRVRIELLGGFRATGPDGGDLGLSGRKLQALIGYLAVEGRAPHRRDRLAALLWGDMGDDRARHNLRQALSKIRRVAAGLLVAEEDAVRLDPDACDVDVRELSRLLDAGDDESRRRAIDLYRGELLDGLAVREAPFEEWLEEARRHLRRRACEAMDVVAHSLAQRDRFDEATALFRRRLSMDPACEPAHRGLMELLARAGRRTEALRQYQECVEALARELGTRPEVATTEAYERIRTATTPSVPARVETAPARATAEPPSIAVLPFEDLSADENRYFSEGIADDIVTSLSYFGSLVVIARPASFAYRDREVPLARLGAELGAQFVLRGSVRRESGKVRINVQLLDTATGHHLWAQRFDRELEELLSMQDEVTTTVVSTLAGRVEAARLARARRMRVADMDAYDFVLRGKDHYYRKNMEDNARAIEMFERAIEHDADFAVAHAWLACALGQRINYRPEEMTALVDRAHDEAERGRQLDPGDSECHRILAQVAMLRGEMGPAVFHAEQSVALNPSSDRALAGLGEILVYAGRHAEGEAGTRRAMRLNPYHPKGYWAHLGRALFHQGRDREALEAYDHMSRPPMRDLPYRLALRARAGDTRGLAADRQALQKRAPRFDPERFVLERPYVRDEDRRQVLDALRAAGL